LATSFDASARAIPAPPHVFSQRFALSSAVDEGEESGTDGDDGASAAAADSVDGGGLKLRLRRGSGSASLDGSDVDIERRGGASRGGSTGVVPAGAAAPPLLPPSQPQPTSFLAGIFGGGSKRPPIPPSPKAAASAPGSARASVPGPLARTTSGSSFTVAVPVGASPMRQKSFLQVRWESR
jgi:hypothetical protein